MRLDDRAGAPPFAAFPAVERIARGCAAAGGLLLLATALLVTASVVSRAVANAPIFGIYEVVELATGIAVLSFFPYTHISRGNVVAEFFTQNAPERVRDLLDLVADALFLAVASFAFWRVTVGFVESLSSRDRTFVLKLPGWVFYGPATLWLALLVAVSAAVLWASAARALR